MPHEVSKTPAQVERNFAAFREKLPSLLASHAGKVAVMHDGEIVEFFDTYADAVKVGLAKFGDFGNFSVQEVTDQVQSLGIYSYAGYLQQRSGRSGDRDRDSTC